MKKYLDFLEIETALERKTKKFRIFNKFSGDDIGTIKWNGAWRQYCFYPDYETHWARGCLAEVQEFIYNLMAQRKAEVKE